mmetsp:Transcript_21971/g.32452  ORF Transcript_21971/g.32452 Transcript_21971/m.32452 type:complete len:360 (+) Transcript_21971:92-1171(+)
MKSGTMKRTAGKSRLGHYLILALYTVAITMLHVQYYFTPPPTPPPPRLIYRRDKDASSKPTTFLLGIFTVLQDVSRRKLIRETMLLQRDLPDDSRQRVCSLQDYIATNSTKCQIIYTFVIGGNPQASPEWHADSYLPRTLDPNTMLKHEKDIIYLNIKENMNEGKTASWFDYASSQHPELDYIAKADSDALISIPQLISHINGRLPPGNEHPKVYGGFLNEYEACGGAGELCDKIRGKVYMSGQFYWLSQDLARYISQDKVRSRPFSKTHNEDTDLAFLILSYPEPIEFSICNNAKFWLHPLKKEEEWLEAYRKMSNDWYSTSISGWIGGLYDKKELASPVQSIVGKVIRSIKMPIFLD